MMTKHETITDDQIRQLRDEAAAAGDDVQRIICDIALGEEEPTPTADAWEDRWGGGGFAAWEEREIRSVTSAEDAREVCQRAIDAARAMDDSDD